MSNVAESNTIAANITESSHESSGKSSGLMEVGWLIAGKLDTPDRRAVDTARANLKARLEAEFPQFDWEFPLVIREEAVKQTEVDPTQLLDVANRKNGRKNGNGNGNRHPAQSRWDFTIVITSADLKGVYQSEPTVAISRALEAVILSTSQIDPAVWQSDASQQDRAEQMAEKISEMCLHALGFWAGLAVKDGEAHNIMSPPLPGVSDHRHGKPPSDDSANEKPRIDAHQHQQLAEHFVDVADRRLEEQEGKQTNSLRFYALAAWMNRREISRVIWQARAWEFPLRLSRFTTAALSACLVMLMTAEAWDLGMSQSAASVTTLSLIVLLATIAFILQRQRLYLRRTGEELTEQAVLTTVATTAIVTIGVLFTYLVFAVTTLLLTLSLFPPDLAATWIASERPPASSAYFALAGFVAAIGIAIGALGASLEDQHFVRHVTLIDAEY